MCKSSSNDADEKPTNDKKESNNDTRIENTTATTTSNGTSSATSKSITGEKKGKDELATMPPTSGHKQQQQQQQRLRRGKRDKKPLVAVQQQQQQQHAAKTTATAKKRKSKAAERHGNDAPSGGVTALLPSIAGVAVLACGVMAKMGFRGRATVAGIDLGTTNSVVCVQAPAKGVGEIECIPDPATGSPIVPSVVSFLDASERRGVVSSSSSGGGLGGGGKKASSAARQLGPVHPSHVVVGVEAKRRIDSHPHHTLYNAKRVLGRPASDPAVDELRGEVEFRIIDTTAAAAASNEGQGAGGGGTGDGDEREEELDEVGFVVPDTPLPVKPRQIGSYVVNHLMTMARQHLGHDNVKSAVICVPAKFDARQKRATYRAFRDAGVSVARVVEEPTAAALAYGLHRKEGVDYILVYDFGGGTLDISLLHVSDGFVDVMGSDGDDRLGGADFDAAVAHFLQANRGGDAAVDRTSEALAKLADALPDAVDLEEELSLRCPQLGRTPLCTSSSMHTLGEQLKIGLSAYPNHDGEVETQCLAPPLTSSATGSSSGGDDDSTTKFQHSLEDFCKSLEPVKLKLTSQEYDRSVQSLYDRSIVPVNRLLDDLDLTAEDVDEVVMVGGTTRMPQIRTLVREALRTSQLNTHIDPDITVAYGAASVID